MKDAPITPRRSSAPPPEVDAICDAFEAAWLAGDEPQIDEFLAEGDSAHAEVLLRELLLCEWELRQRHGQCVDVDVYHTRLPKCGRVIADLWREWTKEHSESVSDGPAIGSDTTRENVPVVVAGTVIDHYELIEQLGEGGFGTVWVAEQREPVCRRVALKLIKLGMDTKQVVARFEAERQALALMDHPNIAKVFDAGATQRGRPYFVMELIRGIPITQYCDQEKLSTEARLHLFMKVCHAVQHAHLKGIIHRDIKPSNILVSLHDGVPVPKVIDFGIAKAIQQELTEKTIYTQFQQFIGTPAYMSPEQAEMSGLDIDTRSDIYSLGVLLYELLTGATPFDAKELMRSGLDEMRKIIREREPLTPSSRRSKELKAKSSVSEHSALPGTLRVPHPAFDRDLDWIVMKCLEKDRSRRYETAHGLAADLQRHLNDEPVVARPSSTAYKLQKAWRRNKVACVAGAIVILALVLGGAGSTWQAIVAGHARNKADLASTRAIASAKSAEAATRRAEQQEEAMRRRAYAADMNVAHQAVHGGNLGRARELLNQYRPEQGQEDLRGWEWRYLWGLCQSDAMFELCRLSMPVISTAIRPGGNWIAIGGGRTGDVEVWDLSTRRRLAQLTSGEYIAHVAFSPDGSRLAFATYQWLRVWDCATRKIIAAVPLDPPAAGTLDNIVLFLSFSADGQTLITFHRGTAINQWRASDLEVLNSSPIPIGEAWQGTPFAVSSDLKTAVHVEDPNGIVVIDLESGQERWRYKSPSQYAVAMAISPDGKLLATNFGFSDGTIQIWDLATGESVTELVGHRAWVSTLKFWPDGKTLASASADHTIRIWDTERFKPIRTLQGHTLEVWSLDLSSDGSTLVSGSKNGEVLVWDSKGDSRKPSAWTVPGRHYRFRLSSNGAAIHALQQEPRRVMRYHGPTFARNEVIEEIPTIKEDATCLLSHSGRFLATATGGVLRVWNLDERKLANVFPLGSIESAQSQPLAFSADETRVWIHHWDDNGDKSVLTEWDLAAKLPVRSIADPESVTKFSRLHIHPNNSAIWTGWTGDDGWVGFHDLRTGRTTWPEIAPGPAIPFGPFASSSADGKLLAICHEIGVLTVWDTASVLGNSAPRPVKTLGGILKMFHGSAFSPDGTRLLAGSGGAEAIKLWETRDYHEVLTLEGNGDSFQQISFSADGNILGATTAQGQLHFWRAPTWQEIQATESSQDHGEPSDSRREF